MANKLVEAQSAYLLEGSPTVKKWGQKINEANSLLTAGGKPSLSLEAKTAIAKVLENTQNRMNFELKESTQNTMVGPYKRYALDIITGMFPNLIAMDLVNVQPIENKQGIINYISYSAGAKKGAQDKDSVIATTFNYTGSSKNYTAQEVDESVLVTTFANTTLTTVLDWKPVIPQSVTITVGSDVYTDHGDAKLYKGGSEVSGSTVNYATGVITIPMALAPTDDVLGAYAYNNEYAPADVPELDLSIKSILVQAKSRKLKALWSFDAAYELQKEYGQDLNALLAGQAAAEIAHEIDMEIMDDLHAGAFTSANQAPIVWDAQVPYGVSQAQHFETLKTAFNLASNRIFSNTRRAVGNFIIAGVNVCTVLESTPSFSPAALGNNIGPYFLGTWGGYKIYKNPFYDGNQFLVGYKGNNLFEAGYCYAPYMPVATTQMLMLADFQGQQGWATSYAKKMLNNYMYVPGYITNLV